MARYLLVVSYLAEGAKGVLQEGGTSRRAAAKALFDSIGVTMETFDFAFGSDDAYVIVESPTVEAVAAAALTVSASGAMSARTIPLLSPEQLDAATKLSPTYRAPGA